MFKRLFAEWKPRIRKILGIPDLDSSQAEARLKAQERIARVIQLAKMSWSEIDQQLLRRNESRISRLMRACHFA